MAALGGSDLSRAAIHLIETGKSRPSLRSLRLISQRTRKPISFFVSPGQEVRLTDPPDSRSILELERLAVEGDFAGVLRRIDEMQLPASDQQPAVARIHLAAARAATILGDGSRALAEAQRGLQVAARSCDPGLEAEAQGWIGAAMHVLHDPGALDQLQRALTTCREMSPPFPDLEARILTNIATVQVGQHRWNEAIDTYEAAVRASEGTRDLARMARMYDGLAVAHEARGTLETAAEYAQRALALYEMSRNRAGEARMRTKFAKTLLRSGRVDAAQEQVGAAFEATAASGINTGRSRLFAVAAAVAVARSDAAAAEEYLSQARQIAEREHDAEVLAELWLVEARSAAERGDPAATSRAFEAAVELIAPNAPSAVLAELLTEYASTLEALGDENGAAKQWKAAALAQNPYERTSPTIMRAERARVG